MGTNVIALGGNAILKDDPSDKGQKLIVSQACQYIAKFIKSGEKVAICHGNGPQVGNLLLQQKAGESLKNPKFALDSCVAMTEGSIGYWIQNALNNEFEENNMDNQAITIVTQVAVDENDPAFSYPTKPIGPFYTKEEAEIEQAKEKALYKEDAGRGYRKFVASPTPKKIIEAKSIQSVLDCGITPICVGGGGVPVIREEDKISGVEAVIDKDLSSMVLADYLNADRLIILTAVENVYVNFNKENQRKLEKVTISELEKYIEEKQFAEGSMLPKVKAAIQFVKGHDNREAIITSLENLEKIKEGSGTFIVN